MFNLSPYFPVGKGFFTMSRLHERWDGGEVQKKMALQKLQCQIRYARRLRYGSTVSPLPLPFYLSRGAKER